MNIWQEPPWPGPASDNKGFLGRSATATWKTNKFSCIKIWKIKKINFWNTLQNSSRVELKLHLSSVSFACIWLQECKSILLWQLKFGNSYKLFVLYFKMLSKGKVIKTREKRAMSIFMMLDTWAATKWDKDGGIWHARDATMSWLIISIMSHHLLQSVMSRLERTSTFHCDEWYDCKIKYCSCFWKI